MYFVLPSHHDKKITIFIVRTFPIQLEFLIFERGKLDPRVGVLCKEQLESGDRCLKSQMSYESIDRKVLE